MIKKLLVMSMCLFLQSCSNTPNKVGNIEIYESIDGKRIKEINFYFVDFENLNLDIRIKAKNKISHKDSIIANNIIRNEKRNKNLVLKVLNVKTSILNDIIIEVIDLTEINFKYIGSSQYCVIYAEKKSGKVDLSFAFRSSPPDFYVGKENPYYKNRDK